MAAQTAWKRVDEFSKVRLNAQKLDRVKLLDPALQSLARGHGHTFKLRSVEVDQYGRTVGRYDHYWHGIRVDLSDAIGILGPDDRVESLKYAFNELLEPTGIDLNPSVRELQAEAKARQTLGGRRANLAKGWRELVLEPVIERVFLPLPSAWAPASGAGDPSHSARELKGWRFVWAMQYGSAGTESWTARVDAHSGEVLSINRNASCAPTTLLGKSEFFRAEGNPEVAFEGDFSQDAYSLVRGSLYGVGAGYEGGAIYSNSLPTFGDGLPFVLGQSLASPNAQTQAVDVMIGLNKSYDFYKGMFNRDHIDGSNGYWVPVTVHQENLADPAAASWSRNMWGQESYRIEFRSQFNPGQQGSPTELSVTAHEWTHLVNYRSARVGIELGNGFDQLVVNEALSTILSTACRLWDANTRLGWVDPDHWKYYWTYQPQIHGMRPSDNTARGTLSLFRPRWLSDPSWFVTSNNTYGSDKYAAGGPLLRCFYLLANGADPVVNPDDISDEARGRTNPFLPWGFQGIGAHNASLLFYQALTQTIHGGTDRVGFGAALIEAAQQLFAWDPSQVHAVRLAVAGVNLAPAPAFNLPATFDLEAAATAPALPIGEHRGTLQAVLPEGTVSHHIRVTVPPRATFVANILSQPGMGADVLSEDGAQVLRSLEGRTVTTIHCGRRIWLDADPTVDYCPESSRTVTRVEHPNTSSQPVNLILRIRTNEVRTSSNAYNATMTLTIAEPIRTAGSEVDW